MPEAELTVREAATALEAVHDDIARIEDASQGSAILAGRWDKYRGCQISRVLASRPRYKYPGHPAV